MSELRKIRRALISLSDKTDAIEFASALVSQGVHIISTGGTAAALREAGIAVTEVSDVTGSPEIMDGRVKTLHPRIHGALLALRDDPGHLAAMTEHGIVPIDMIAVNLYPFENTVAREGVELSEAVENIDIGGPAMIRSAAKNWRDVAVVTDHRLYAGIIEEINASDGSLSLETRKRLATLASSRTAAYDLAISSYLTRHLSEADLDFLAPLNRLQGLVFIESEDRKTDDHVDPTEIPDSITLEYSKTADLRYGENPHQKAALFKSRFASGGIAGAEKLHGKEMSFNNYVDAQAAWELVSEFDELAVAIIKHTNPSGVGIGDSNESAYRRALSTDPVSAFGGIVAFNRSVSLAEAALVTEIFTEVVLAPNYDAAALELLRAKKNLRVLRLTAGGDTALALKQISGGMLIQQKDARVVTPDELKVVSLKQPSDKELEAMLFAWKVCKYVKSNAIVFANGLQTIGVGAGQMNRVESLRIAAMRAQRFELPLAGSVIASDAFFPFRDNVDEAAKFGVSGIIQPGGSIKDDESIAAADEHGIAMVFTGVRHFSH